MEILLEGIFYSQICGTLEDLYELYIFKLEKLRFLVI